MSCTAHLAQPLPTARRAPTSLITARQLYYRPTLVRKAQPAFQPGFSFASRARFALHTALAAQDSDFDSAGAEGIEEEPEDARGAIAVGLKYYKAGNYQKALELFGRAPALPGTGTKRFRLFFCRLQFWPMKLLHAKK